MHERHQFLSLELGISPVLFAAPTASYPELFPRCWRKNRLLVSTVAQITQVCSFLQFRRFVVLSEISLSAGEFVFLLVCGLHVLCLHSLLLIFDHLKGFQKE